MPETTAVQETMRDMIVQDGATALFPTSFGYFDPHILKVAKEFPDVQFFHCGGLYVEGKDPKNVGSYFGYIDEAEYVAGIVAGYATKSNKLGFIAAKPIPQVLRNINSYTLGARSVNPKVTVQVVFTGDWSIPVKEAESANSLIDQGVDVLTCHVDSPKVIIETAERRGIYVTGYHTNGAAPGAERLSHRGGVGLDECLYKLCEVDPGWQDPCQWRHPASHPRRAQGGFCQSLPLRRGRE